MKIDFISVSLSGGGAERVLTLLANHFVEKGYDVKIITFNEGDAFILDSKINRVKLHHGKITNHKIRSLKNLTSYYYHKNNRPDVIISFLTHINLISILVAKLYRIKIIASEHNSFLRVQDPKFLTHITRTFLYPQANFLTVLTNFDIPYYKKKKINVVVMPNPCTFKIQTDLDLRREKIILAVGSLDRYHHKGFDNLLKLIAPILKNHNDWTLQIVGGGSKGFEHLKKLTFKYNIIDQVQFTGFRKDVNILMQKSEIFILPSRFEGLPMVLLEALSQGLACVAYDCKTGPSDIIEHGKNGILVEDQNIQIMQQELKKLINNPTLRKELRINGVKSLDKFSIENIGKSWEGLFNELKIL
tara:strand:+ start:3974 stop:5050 length:1077 start_codon:yes stop_codon:yes gene_type:complete